MNLGALAIRNPGVPSANGPAAMGAPNAIPQPVLLHLLRLVATATHGVLATFNPGRKSADGNVVVDVPSVPSR